MAVTERVRKLRQESLNAKPTLSAERAQLVTRYYQQEHDLMSVPVKRALFFKFLMENKTICIYPGELIVGEKGPSAKASPHLPRVVLP